MSPSHTRRGHAPDDDIEFGGTALLLLKRAADELQYLRNHQYPMTSSLKLVGDHHQLSRRQRTALQRMIAPNCAYQNRKRKEINGTQLDGKKLAIDGFNLIITLETALSGSLLLCARDGCIRDLAGLRGTYRIISQTEHAIALIGRILNQSGLDAVQFYLDSPVSNSGRLKNLIEKLSSEWNMPVSVTLAANPDLLLAAAELTASSDSLVLDQCFSWYNLGHDIITREISQAWVLKL